MRSARLPFLSQEPSSLPRADSLPPLTRRTNFERAEGQLIKPDTFCVDIGLFTVEKAYEAAQLSYGQYGMDRGSARFRSRRSR